MTSTESEADMCCASCGIAEVDDTKLRTCTACKSVRYCSVNCQRDNWPKHKRACKKRAAELHDEILFRQPESSHLGDCPICLLPLPLDAGKFTMMSCCSKMICDGCKYANKTMWHVECPLCREPVPDTDEEMDLNVMKRAEANDPVAIRLIGSKCRQEGDYGGALEHFTRAAKLGDAAAHYQLSALYEGGEGVVRDKKKELYHLEQAAIGGHPLARHNLGCEEGSNGRYERSVKHFIIAASSGLDDSMELLKECYEGGGVSKADFAAALGAYQAAKEVRKSPQREAAEAAKQNSEQVVELSDEQKRRDEILFKQPEGSDIGDCPICLLPLPIDDTTKRFIASCCSKSICKGCLYTSITQEDEEVLRRKCLSCQQPYPQSRADEELNMMKRAEVNDPVAIREMGAWCYEKEDYAGALEYWTKAAKLGDARAHYQLSTLYYEGKVVEKDEKKFLYHAEEAAIGGNPMARLLLGAYEEKNRNTERANKHFIIAANLGHDESLKLLEEGCELGIVKKEDLAAALRAHKSAVDATKSPQRELAEAVAQQNADRDEILFRQPECSYLGDCPICLLPLDIDNDKSTMMSCCSKLICDGCSHANMVRVIEGSLEYKCAFCRHPIPDTEEEMDLNVMKRINANDPVAIREKGTKCYEKGDYASALDCWTKAAKLGDIDAHFRLGKSYHFGEGVEKDINKQTYHWEIAAIGGHPNARHNLGCEEWNSGNFHRGVAYFIISANHGHGLSIEILKKGYSLGCVAKEDFAAALRAHQAAVDAMQSPQRKAAAEARQNQTWPYLRHSD